MRIHIARRGSALWQRCVDLAREKYARDYDANIEPSPDCFIALGEHGADGIRPLACAGLTYGGARPLLVEHYLGVEAHNALTAIHCQRVDPHDLVEVGPLASQYGGAGLQVIKLLPALCWCHGAKFFLCTVTASLARALAWVGIEFIPLTQAQETALPGDLQGRWGSYYETKPLAGYVDLRGFDAELVKHPHRAYRVSVTLANETATVVGMGA